MSLEGSLENIYMLLCASTISSGLLEYEYESGEHRGTREK